MLKSKSVRKTPKKSPNRRGSAEAIEKRRVARLFNDVLGGRSPLSSKLDGRTEKRRQRLLQELERGVRGGDDEGEGARALKPIDVLQHVQELMDLGEPLTAIRKATGTKKVAIPDSAATEIVELVERLHKAYNFRPEVYRFVGITDDTLATAGVLPNSDSSRQPSRKKKS